MVRGDEEVSVSLPAEEAGVPTVRKALSLQHRRNDWSWSIAGMPRRFRRDGFFAPEVSYAGPLEMTAEPSVRCLGLRHRHGGQVGEGTGADGAGTVGDLPLARGGERREIEMVARGR